MSISVMNSEARRLAEFQMQQITHVHATDPAIIVGHALLSRLVSKTNKPIRFISSRPGQ